VSTSSSLPSREFADGSVAAAADLFTSWQTRTEDAVLTPTEEERLTPELVAEVAVAAFSTSSPAMALPSPRLPMAARACHRQTVKRTASAAGAASAVVHHAEVASSTLAAVLASHRVDVVGSTVKGASVGGDEADSVVVHEEALHPKQAEEPLLGCMICRSSYLSSYMHML
jgi:hypothetical protein